MNLRFVMTSMLCLAWGANASATVVVDATGATAGSVTTINAALAGTDTDILVKNTGLYTEALVVTRNVTIRGENPASRPIIAMQANATQPAQGGLGDGIYVGGTSGGNTNQTIALKNLILIPALAGGITDDAITGTANAGAILNLTLENILIAPNNGSNVPLATTVWDDPVLTASGVVRVPDDGVYFADDEFAGFDGNIEATLKDVVIIGVGGSNTTGDAIVLYPGDGASTVTMSGIGTSFARRYGGQLGKTNCPYTLVGTQSKPSWIARRNQGPGVAFLRGQNVVAQSVVSLDNGTFGFRADADSVQSLQVTDSLIARNGAEGFWSSFAATAPRNWTIATTTFYNNGRNGTDLANVKLEAAITPDVTLTLTDCIIAGPGSTGFENLGPGTIVANNCGLVTLGPDALQSVLRAPSTGVVTINNAVNADPGFVSTATSPVTASSFDVTSGAYATASSTAGPLNGWGDGPPPANVADWNMY